MARNSIPDQPEMLVLNSSDEFFVWSQANDRLERVSADKVTGSVTFTDLDDTPANYTGQAGKVVRVNGTEDGLEYADDADTDNFLGLTDTPANYTGQAGQVVAVNTGETALEFITPSGGGGGGAVGAIVRPSANWNMGLAQINPYANIPWGTVVHDDGSHWSSGNNTRLTAQTTGWHIVGCYIVALGPSDDGQVNNGWKPYFRMRTNGSTSIGVFKTQHDYYYDTLAQRTDYFQRIWSLVTRLNANDYVEVRAYPPVTTADGIPVLETSSRFWLLKI